MMGNQKYIHIICMDCICIVKEELKVIKGEGENKHLEKDKKNVLYVTVTLNTEKAMAPHSSTLAWKIPWMEEPGRLRSMGSLRVGHD